jgi:hypothetical protein
MLFGEEVICIWWCTKEKRGGSNNILANYNNFLMEKYLSSCTIFSPAIVTCQDVSQETHWRVRQEVCLMQTDVMEMSSQSVKFL